MHAVAFLHILPFFELVSVFRVEESLVHVFWEANHYANVLSHRGTLAHFLGVSPFLKLCLVEDAMG